MSVGGEESADVVLNVSERGRGSVARVAAEHGYDAFSAVGIAGQLVMTLDTVDGIAADFQFALSDEAFAYLFHGGDDDAVEEMMSLDVEIGFGGGYAELAQFGIELLPTLAGFGVQSLEFTGLLGGFPPDVL